MKDIKPIQDAEEFLLAASNVLQFMCINDEMIEDVVLEQRVTKDQAIDLLAQDLRETIENARFRLTQAENSLDKLEKQQGL